MNVISKSWRNCTYYQLLKPHHKFRKFVHIRFCLSTITNNDSTKYQHEIVSQQLTTKVSVFTAFFPH